MYYATLFLSGSILSGRQKSSHGHEGHDKNHDNIDGRRYESSHVYSFLFILNISADAHLLPHQALVPDYLQSLGYGLGQVKESRRLRLYGQSLKLEPYWNVSTSLAFFLGSRAYFVTCLYLLFRLGWDRWAADL